MRSCASTSACGRTYGRLGQRLYAWLQGTHRDSYDDAIEFYLAAPLRYTLGLRGRQHRAAGSVRAALNQLYAADRALQPRAEVEHPRPLREHQPPRVQDQPPSPRIRSHRACSGTREVPGRAPRLATRPDATRSP